MFSVVLDLLDLRGLISNVLLTIPDLCAVVPRRIPQAIHDIHVLVCNTISLIMRDKIPAEGIRSGLGPARDDIPRYAALREVIQRAERSS
jgi:hypothetical protein